MNIQEMRIGNRLKDKAANYEFNVVGIDTDNDIPHVHALYESGVVSMLFPEETEPVILTEPVLKYFGFSSRKQTNQEHLYQYNWELLKHNGTCVIIMTVIKGEYRLFKNMNLVACRRINYIHEFQNWFYINTGYDLIFRD